MAPPCARLQLVRGPVRSGGNVRPLNSGVRLHKDPVLHPNQFQPDEAWIAFRLNAEPVRTELEGSFNVFALMDAASCFIFGAEFVAAKESEPRLPEVKRLFASAQERVGHLPGKLYLPKGQFKGALAREAERRGIAVVRVPENDLLPFIGEACRGFNSRFVERAQ